jgi:tetratricopeptide (TPR) repeat protein
MVSITRHERFGFNFVNISVKPKKISIGYSQEKDQYYFNFELAVSLKKDEKFVYQYDKNFDFYIDPDEVKVLKGNGIVIHDSFPVLPGKYKLMVFAKNSVGKEFTYFDTDINSFPSGGMSMLTKPIVGYKTEDRFDNFFYPYKINKNKLFVDPERTFRLKTKPYLLLGIYNLKKELWKSGKVEIDMWGLNERVKFRKKFTLNLNDYEFEKNLQVFHRLSQEGLSPDYYECEIKLVNNTGTIMDRKTINFTISPLKNVAYPMETFKKARLDNPYFFYYILGSQFESIGQLENAERYYELVTKSNPNFWDGHVALLNLLNKRKKYTKVLVEAEILKKNKDRKFDYLFIRGLALYGMKNYEKALDQLLKANEIYNSDIRVLNLLGFTLLNLKEFKEALKAFDASLNLNKKQPFILRTVKEVKQKLDSTPLNKQK